MKSKIYKVLSTLSVDCLIYTLQSEGCQTLGDLVKKLEYRYTKDDVHMAYYHLLNAYKSAKQ